MLGNSVWEEIFLGGGKSKELVLLSFLTLIDRRVSPVYARRDHLDLRRDKNGTCAGMGSSDLLYAWVAFWLFWCSSIYS